MYHFVLLTVVFILGSSVAIAKSADSASATYIMQVSSNLNCETLDIELISQARDIPQHLKFGAGAFAAAELPLGTYKFGDVTCAKESGTQTFDMLKNMIAPLYLSTNQVYYGGRIIFQEVSEVDANQAPKVLSNCTRLISRARGDTGNECRDGVGVDTSAQKSKMLKVFFPEVTDEDIKTVRSALSATEDQFRYLPLQG